MSRNIRSNSLIFVSPSYQTGLDTKTFFNSGGFKKGGGQPWVMLDFAGFGFTRCNGSQMTPLDLDTLDVKWIICNDLLIVSPSAQLNLVWHKAKSMRHPIELTCNGLLVQLASRGTPCSKLSLVQGQMFEAFNGTPLK